MSKETKKSAGAKKPAKATKAAAPKKGPATKAESAPAATKRPTAVKAKASPKAAAPKQGASAAAPKASKPAAAKSTPKPSSKSNAKQTAVTVRADVGFGNQLFIRGEGGDLSWEQGVPMKCKANDHWEWSAQGVDQKVLFKILINDEHWSGGENFEVQAGDSAVVEPRF